MDAHLVRQLWSAVESFPKNRLSALDDSTLLQSLIDFLQSDPAFDPQNLSSVSSYILARTPLIREMSQQS
ncbi:MAG: hypothetical protein AAFO06_11590 [Cyanobacteria bacterium J06597_16]